MSFTAWFEISPSYMAGNPIPITIHITPGYSVVYRVNEVDGPIVFTGKISSLTGTQTVNLSRLFNLTSVQQGIKTYILELVSDNTVLQSQTFSVYPGAISKLLHRELARKSLDIFSTKLNDTSRNFLLTTRSFSTVIIIPEDELLPIPYYGSGKTFSIFGEPVVPAMINGVAYLDVKAIIAAHYNTTGELVSSFPVIYNDMISFTVAIIEADYTHTHFIKFRNSLGAQEMLALENVVNYIPSFSSQEIGIFDPKTNDQIQVPFPVSFSGKYTAQLRNMRADEMLMAMDMLLSREQYLITPRGEFQVKVKADDQVFQTTSGAPLKINVNIETVEDDSYFSPIDLDRITTIYENIFTNEFTMQFT